MTLKSTGSLLSQLSHLVAYTVSASKNQLEKGALIVSVDVDVGSRLLAQKNKGLYDAYVHNNMSEFEVACLEEPALPVLIHLFNNLEIPVTFAFRGQLAETDGSAIEILRDSCVEHDIGAHGYSHRSFTSLSNQEAENELRLISKAMKKCNIEPKSFVFPKNQIAHLSLLEKFGYKCYRGRDGFRYDRLHIEKHNQLYEVHPSFFLGWSTCSVFLNKIIDISAKKKLPLHVWFHAHDFGGTRSRMERKVGRVLLPILKHAKIKEKEGTLSFETMLSVVTKLEEAKRKCP